MRKEATTIISLSDVSLTLPGPHNNPVDILHDIGMQVQAGESVSITGPSGSGKTSLMMLIAGVEQPSAGNMCIAGEEIVGYDEDALAAFRRRHIGVVFQNFHLVPTMTARENIEVALDLVGAQGASDIAAQSLRDVGLDKRMDHYPDQLSGGEQQRVALARAFATKPKILLADEPTGNLDSTNGKHVIELLFGLKEQYHTTLVLITHDMGLAALATRQFEMKDGRLHEQN